MLFDEENVDAPAEDVASEDVEATEAAEEPAVVPEEEAAE